MSLTLEMPAPLASVPQTSASFPAWFADRQKAAWERYLATPAPKRGDEPWRFANFKQLDFYKDLSTDAVPGVIHHEELVIA